MNDPCTVKKYHFVSDLCPLCGKYCQGGGPHNIPIPIKESKTHKNTIEVVWHHGLCVSKKLGYTTTNMVQKHKHLEIDEIDEEDFYLSDKDFPEEELRKIIGQPEVTELKKPVDPKTLPVFVDDGAFDRWLHGENDDLSLISKTNEK